MSPRWWFGVLALVAMGCAQPAADELGCAKESPSHLGRSCDGDGECGNWLVCAEECQLPPAVSGEGGVLARVTGAGLSHELRVEVARGDLARTRGLGHRPCIAEGWGLVIEYPTPDAHVITTTAMRFALDIAY